MSKVRLGDVFVISSGGTPSKTHPEYYNGSIPWVKTGELKEKYINYVEMKITEEGFNNSSTKMYEKGTVLLAMYGATIGAVSILNIDACTNQACAAFRINKDIIPEYLYYFLVSQKQHFIHDGVGGAQPNISARYLKKYLFPLRDKAQQISIINILGLLDRIIYKSSLEINKLDELIKSRFVEMFGDPILNQRGFPVYELGEVIHFQGGSQPEKKYFEYEPTENNIRLIQIRDYKSDNYITYIPKSMAKRFCTADDIMIGRYGPPIFQILKGIEGAFNVALMKATPKTGNKEFIRQFLKQDCLLEYLEGLSKRTAGQDGIQMDKLKSYPFPLPPKELQNAFADFASKVEQQKVTVQKSIEKLETLKKSLMQEYFG